MRFFSCLILIAASAAFPAHGQQGPAVFGPGVFSTAAWDFFVAFMPDQRTAYVCRANGNFSYYTILETRLVNGRWTEPRTAPFSGRWSDADPHISPDGSKLFFISNRPVNGTEPTEEYDVWVVERETAGRWGEPRHLAAPVNSDSVTEWSPSVARNGNLYFGSDGGGGKGSDLYVARWANGGYQKPENLGDSVNTAAGEVEPWIAPDETYLIFSAYGRPDGVGGYDLFISERRNGVWQRARPLGGGVNSAGRDFNQSVSPDGKYLYFSSTRGIFDSIPGRRLAYPEMQRRLTGIGNGLGDIYRIPLRELGIEGER
jgi:Tol biopolymer transport system component